MFQNRKHAGILLAKKLMEFKDSNALVLGLPRGGVPVAFEIAVAIHSPMDVLTVRKIGSPHQPEFGVGALCEDDQPIWNESTLTRLGLKPEDLGNTVEMETERIQNQIQLFRQGRKAPSVTKKLVIVVDDGLATGATMSAAVKYLKKKGASKIVVAIPVAARRSIRKLRARVDKFVTLHEPEDLRSVGEWYDDFTQVSDEEVIFLLNQQNRETDVLENYP